MVVRLACSWQVCCNLLSLTYWEAPPPFTIWPSHTMDLKANWRKGMSGVVYDFGAPFRFAPGQGHLRLTVGC